MGAANLASPLVIVTVFTVEGAGGSRWKEGLWKCAACTVRGGALTHMYAVHTFSSSQLPTAHGRTMKPRCQHA